MKKSIVIATLFFFVCSTALAAPSATPGTRVKGNKIVTRGNKPIVIPAYTVATLPTLTSVDSGATVRVSDGADASDCTVGGGASLNTCLWNGSAYVSAGDGVGAGTASGTVATLDGTGDAGAAATHSRGDHKHAVTPAGIGAQAADADLTTYAGITPSANVQSLLGAADYAAMRVLLDLEAGTDFYSVSGADAAFQPLDADLTTYAGITPSANVQTFLGSADFAAMRTNLSLVVGTNVQAYDADLTTYAGITPSANVQSVLGAADYAAIRSLLGLDTGDSPSLTALTLTGAAGITSGVASTTSGKITLLNSSNANTTAIVPGAATGNIQFTLPTAYAGGNGYLITSTTGGVLGYVDPATLGTGAVTLEADCSDNTSGGCVDSDDGLFYTWDGVSAMKLVGPITSVDLDLTENYVLIGDATGKAAEVAIDDDLSTTSASHDTVPSALSVKTVTDTLLPLAGGTMTDTLITDASDATASGVRLPHGTAPSSPTNGDLWTTTAGLYARINGSTVGPYGTGGGVSISGTPAQYEWAEWTDASTLKGTAVTGSSVVCTDANGSAAACSNLTDDADLATYAGITPSANVQTLLANANYADFLTDLFSGGYTAAAVPLDFSSASSVVLPSDYTVAVTNAPIAYLLDSDAPGSDKEVASWYAQYDNGGDGAEDGIAYLAVMEGGTRTPYIELDGALADIEMKKPTAFESTTTFQADDIASSEINTIVDSVFWDSGGMVPDGTQCAVSSTAVTINSGPMQYTAICTDNDAATLYGHIVMPDSWDGGTVTAELEYLQTAADTSALNSDITMQCRGATETVNSTWGTEVAIDDAAVTGSNAVDHTTSAAITPNGTCAGGDTLYWRWQLDATGTTTAVATLHILGLKVEYTSNVGD